MRFLSLIGNAFAHTYWREEPIVGRLRTHLSGVETVLDIGAGGCRIAKLLGAHHRIDVTAIDVVDHNVTDVPLLLYDGTTLPFANNTFDVSLLIFTLHHATSPQALLREAIRVTRSSIFVVEDVPGNAIERRCWRTWDYLLNHGAHGDIAVAHQSRNLSQWVELLTGAGLTPASYQIFRMWFPVLYSYPHALLHAVVPRD